MITLVCSLLLVTSPVIVDELDLAGREYRAGRYQRALDWYRSALSQPGVSKAHVLYNIGNCAYRLGRHAEAVLHYRRAKLRMPGDQAVEWNLGLAERRLGTVGASSDSIWSGLLARLDATRPATLLTIVFVLETLGLLGLVLLGSRKPGVSLALVLLGLAGAARLAQTQAFPGLPEAVVLAQIGLRTEPHTAQPVLLELEPGQIVRVAELSDRWVRVVHEQASGWTERAGIGVVD